MYRIVREIIQDNAKQNVKYMELRSTPKAFKDIDGKFSNKEDYVNTVIKAMQDGEEEFNGEIRVRFMMSLRRDLVYNEADSKELVDLAVLFKERRNKYVVGIELSGDPRIG